MYSVTFLLNNSSVIFTHDSPLALFLNVYLIQLRQNLILTNVSLLIDLLLLLW